MSVDRWALYADILNELGDRPATRHNLAVAAARLPWGLLTMPRSSLLAGMKDTGRRGQAQNRNTKKFCQSNKKQISKRHSFNAAALAVAVLKKITK